MLTRLTTRAEPSFAALFWPAIVGVVLTTAIGLPNLQPVRPEHILPLAIYSGLSILSHWLLMKCYEQVEAARVQPYAYLQIVFVTLIGLTIYDERLTLPVAIGAAIVVAAGLYALTQDRRG